MHTSCAIRIGLFPWRIGVGCAKRNQWATFVSARREPMQCEQSEALNASVNPSGRQEHTWESSFPVESVWPSGSPHHARGGRPWREAHGPWIECGPSRAALQQTIAAPADTRTTRSLISMARARVRCWVRIGIAVGVGSAKGIWSRSWSWSWSCW